jgi:hypothetical protein
MKKIEGNTLLINIVQYVNFYHLAFLLSSNTALSTAILPVNNFICMHNKHNDK